MKISNIEISNFRNIVKADISFGDINIITGRNSSGKSNFLLGLYYASSLERDYSTIFRDNIVTYQKGKDKTKFKVTIGDVLYKAIYNRAKDILFISPKKFIFEKIIDKKTSSSRSHKLLFSGEVSVKERSPQDETEEGRLKLFSNLEKIARKVENQEVYNESFISKEESPNTKVINISSVAVEDQDKYLSLFKEFFDTIVAWIEDTGSFSTHSIYKFVINRLNIAEYEQVIGYLNSPINKKDFSVSPFKKAKFLFLLADIQRSDDQKTEFKKDLNIYTKGIVTDLFINTEGGVGNKGEIKVKSPQGPKDIFSISTGTAILLYFIVLKNWIKLPYYLRTYQKPEVMIFDEVESIIHPSLMDEFYEIIRSISKNIQLFITTHNPRFIDFFDKKEVFLLKDNASQPGESTINRCNILDFESIIKSLPIDKQSVFMKTNNSELFIDGTLDLIFPEHVD